MNNDFYIGYLDKAPASVSRFTKNVVLILLAGVLLVAFLLVISQRPFYPSTFEFLQYQQFSGTLHAHPYPMLQVLRPGEPGELPAYSYLYLVNEGKFGTQDLAQEYDGQRVAFEGALIYRDDQVMIELKKGTLKLQNDREPIAASTAKSLGTFTLTGEIVDSKCFLGVMNPGSTKPHRACATRCISGGIPPLFVVKAEDETTRYLMLQNNAGEPVNDLVLDKVAEPLQITGEVLQHDDVLILKSDPSSYLRLNR